MGPMNMVIKAMLGRMSKEDKQQMMSNLTDKFLAGMTDEDKQKMMNDMMGKFLASTTFGERQNMMAEIMPRMMEGVSMTVIMPQIMAAMMRGGQQQQQGNMMGMMPMMMSMMGSRAKSGEGEEPLPVMESSEDFRPWESCPCRKLCERGFTASTEEGSK
jgi:hypothetical protein